MDEKERLRESIADLQHEIWAIWMEHLFNVSYHINDGSVWVHAKNVECWRKQINTPYYKLSEEDKDKDRKIADKILELIP